LVDNWNALFKVAIRGAVESLRGGEAHAVHGSDNAFEAAYLLECLELSLAAG
jgi:hypothetical protein